jgi:hypothetical protein
MTDPRDHTADDTDHRRDDTHETRRSADSAPGPVAAETTQTLADLLAFLRADALEVYDALDADVRARVDRCRRDYRGDVSRDVVAGAGAERLLKRAAVDQYRAGSAAGVIVRHGLSGGGDHADAVRDVAREMVRLSSRRRARLRRLGVYSVDGGDTVQ